MADIFHYMFSSIRVYQLNSAYCLKALEILSLSQIEIRLGIKGYVRAPDIRGIGQCENTLASILVTLQHGI